MPEERGGHRKLRTVGHFRHAPCSKDQPIPGRLKQGLFCRRNDSWARFVELLEVGIKSHFHNGISVGKDFLNT